MIWGRIIWGIIISCLLGLNFYRTWKWEHGGETFFSNKYGKETYVLIQPTFLFWILLAMFGISCVFYGIKNGLIKFTAMAAELMIFLSIYYVLLLLFLPLLRKIVSARACAILWLIPAFLSWQVHMLIRTLPIPKFTILIPRNALFLVSLVWLAGALLAGGYYFISNLLFVSSVKKNTVEETDEEILSVWEKMRERLEYKRPTRLLRGDVSTPFSMGQTKFTRCTILPNRTYTQGELSMILSHELHHLERCDVNTKVFLCLCNAICWFNPLVWVATKRAAEDLERSCDEIVTENMDEEERRRYAELLLTFVAPQRGFTTCLSAAAGTLRYRLKSVMEQKKRLLGTLLLSAVLFVSVICFGNVAISVESGTFKEMLSKYDATIGSIYDVEYSKIESWDAEALMDTLSKIELRHLAGPRDPEPKTPAMTFVLTDGHRITVFDNTVFVNTHKNLGRNYECYVAKEKIDVDMIYEVLNK